MARRRKQRPTDPQEIMRRRLEDEAEVRAARRAAEKDPGSWGLDENVITLPMAANVAVTNDPHSGRLIHARRSDAFTLLHSAGGLTDEQHAAAGRYFRDWCNRAGYFDNLPDIAMAAVDRSPGLCPGQNVSQAMIDAGKRIAKVHGKIGRADERLLTNLVEPLVMRGQIRVWRVLVSEITREKEKHAQSSVVRRACQNLFEAYEEIDTEKDEHVDGRPNVIRLHPFAGGTAE